MVVTKVSRADRVGIDDADRVSIDDAARILSHTVRYYDNPETIRADWERLAARAGTRMSSRFLYAVGAHNIDGNGSFLLVAVYRGSEMVALAPFAVRRMLTVEVVRLLGHGRGVIGEILADDADAARALWRAVADRGLVLHADLVVGSDVAVSALLDDPRWNCVVRVRDTHLSVDVPEGTVPADIRSARSLKRLRSYRTALSRSGSSLEFEQLTTPADVDRRWSDLCVVAAIGTSGRDRVNFLAPPNEQFVYRFLRAEAELGRLVILGLVIDGVWCAHDVSVRTGNRLEGWVTHYRPECAHTQPGHQMMEWLVAQRKELAVDVLDMGIGPTDLKLVWANNRTPVVTITGVQSGRIGARAIVRAIETWESGSLVSRSRNLRDKARAVLRRGREAVDALGGGRSIRPRATTSSLP
jgi:CelD/BcsL family acetyltransferase involved in cellulose biosynthesis